MSKINFRLPLIFDNNSHHASREFSSSGRQSTGTHIEVLPAFFKGSIVQSLQQVFGEVGGLSVSVDLLRFEEEENNNYSAILRVPASDCFKLRTALNLVSEFQGHPCRFNIHCLSPVLLSLVRTRTLTTTTTVQ